MQNERRVDSPANRRGGGDRPGALHVDGGAATGDVNLSAVYRRLAIRWLSARVDDGRGVFDGFGDSEPLEAVGVT